MGNNSFAPFLKINGCFIVRNICADPKRTIRIFQYPINNGDIRDLLQIPGVAEADIRASLLKGELKQRIDFNEITVICSDIDLLQFNLAQKTFLQGAGIVNGLDVSATATVPYKWVEEIDLIGVKNNSNRTFMTPDKFLNGIFTDGSKFHIHVKHDGKDLYEGIDYTILESGGPGTGFDVVYITAFAPKPRSLLKATYAVKI